jgi:hypothetical protein
MAMRCFNFCCVDWVYVQRDSVMAMVMVMVMVMLAAARMPQS